MPVHDWTRVSAGTFHHFHSAWITHIAERLNGGVLPPGYYALAEQLASEVSPDVLVLESEYASGTEESPFDSVGLPGATAVAERPPKVRFTLPMDEAVYAVSKTRVLAIRHASGDNIVALVEIVSPGNKSTAAAFEHFVDKAVSALFHGYHMLLIDLLPPGKHDPAGVHSKVWERMLTDVYSPPPGEPLTLAAYAAGPIPVAYVEPVAVGAKLPDMPLFLDRHWYVNVPLEETYCAAWQGVPDRWKRVIEAKGAT